MTQKSFADFGYIVESCPINETEYFNSAKRLSCGMDENERSQYVCVPNHDKSTLVEFCYNSTVGLYEKANCIKVYESGRLDQTSCLNFTHGCPPDHFFPTDLYKYPACHEINFKERCFYADPVCPNSTSVTPYERERDREKDTLDKDTSLDNGILSTKVIAGITIPLIIAVVMAVIIVIYILMKQRQRFSKADSTNEVEEVEFQAPLIPGGDAISNAREREGNKDETPSSEKGLVFPKTLRFEHSDVEDIVKITRKLEDIYPKESEESIAYQLLQSLYLDKFKSRIKSLESSVILVDPTNSSHIDKTHGHVCILRVEVKQFNKQLDVQENDTLLDLFQSIKYLPKVFLVTSHSAFVIDTKLSVYKKYKSMFEENKYRIFHEFDSDKEHLLHCTKHTIDAFQDQIEKIVESIPMQHLKGFAERAANEAFSKEEIQKCCQKIEIVNEAQHIGSIHSGTYSCRLPSTVQKIKGILISSTFERIEKELTNKIYTGVFEHIDKIQRENFLNETNDISTMNEFTCKKIGKVVISPAVVEIAQLLSRTREININFATVGLHLRELFWPVDVNSLEWRNKIANEIYEKLSEREEQLISNLQKTMECVFDKTKRELMEVKDKLATASKNIPIIDQEKLIGEWMLRDFRIRDIQNCPSIVGFRAGRKHDKIVMKVFLKKYDAKSELFCRQNAVNTPKDATFEFVSNSKRKSGVMQKKEKEFNKITETSRETKRRMKEIISNEKQKLYAKYSILVSVYDSPVKYCGGRKINEDCIVLCCLDADLIPFGEEPLPKYLKEFECNIIEDYMQLATCEKCKALDQGCSIGRFEGKSSGSVGFFAKTRSQSPPCFGFLTAAHVVLPGDFISKMNERRLSECSFGQQGNLIVHPSFEDSGNNNVIGKVEDAFFGNYKSVGIDAAFVKTDAEIYKQKLQESTLNFCIDPYEEYDVVKKGRASGETKGILKDCSFSIRSPFPDHNGIYLLLDNCYTIHSRPDSVFFLPGDSGSAVYIINKSDGSLQPLGLAFGSLSYPGITMVCPIDTITEVFDLSILQPAEPKESPLQL